MTEINELELAVLEDFRKREMAINKDCLGKRPPDIADQIAWNLYHLNNGRHDLVYPRQEELMQRLGHVDTALGLTEKGRDIYGSLSKSGYYTK